MHEKQLGIFRIAFGAFIAWYQVRLFPFAVELYSRDGVFPDSSMNWTYGYFPNLLLLLDSAGSVQGLMFLSVVLALAFMIGLPGRRAACALLFYLSACFYNRNNLTEDPSLPFVAWLLVAFAFIPETESFRAARVTGRSQGIDQDPTLKRLVGGAWVLLAVSYCFSGISKWSSPLWVSGDAVGVIYQLPIAYEWASAIASRWPALGAFATWLTLGAQTLAPALFLWRVSRPWAWLVLTLDHVVLLFTLEITQVSLGMIFFHLFVLDLSWFDLCRLVPRLRSPARTPGAPA